MSKNQFGLLSEREEQVLLLSTKGLTDKEIARKLRLSIATVNTYWVRIRTKLGGANRAELVAAALHKNAEQTLTAKELENQRLISEVVRRAEAEKALRESQSRLQAIIDGTPVVVYIKDLQGRYTLVNKELETVMGRDRREILGKRDNDLFGPEIGEQHRAQDHKIIETGEPAETEVRIDTKSGPRYFLNVKFALVNTDGARYAVCGFAREITGRIETESAVQRSEERYRALIENSVDIITLLDERGDVLYVSPAFHKALGYDSSSVVGTNAFRFICREDLKRITTDFRHLLTRPGATIESEYRLKAEDGSAHYVEGHAANLLEEPAVRAVVLNYRDVTRRKMTELRLEAAHGELDRSVEAIEEERRKYRDLFEQAPDGYVVTDLKGRIIEANRAACELFESTESEFVGKNLKEFVIQDLQNAFSAGFSSLDELQRIREWELKVRSLNKSVFDASISVAAVRDSKGNAISHRWLIRDVSKRKFVEHELKAANEALERRVRTRTVELEDANQRLQEEIAERKRAEEDLILSHQLAQSVLASSMDGIITFDSDCRFTTWNKSMEKISGVNQEDVIGQCGFEMFPFLSDMGADDYCHRALAGESGVSRNRKFAISGTDRIGTFDIHYSPIKSEAGEIVGGLAIIRQVQAPKETKAELR